MRGRPPLKEYVQIPTCPFCGMNIARPQEVVAATNSSIMPVGSCTCGAVYAFDVSGKNLGSAFIEALVFACNMDWDMAWGLLPEKDYQENIVNNYDLENHLIIPGGFFEGRKIAGALYFIRLNKDMLGVNRQSVEKLLDKPAISSVSKKEADYSKKKKISKKELETWVKEYRVESVLQAAHQDHKILWLLRRLLCAEDRLLRFRAAELMGKAARIVNLENPGRVPELLKALINSLADTGAASWGAMDAVGEIIASSMEEFAGYLPILLQLLNEEHLRADVLRALQRIAAVKPDLVRKCSSRLLSLLTDTDPEVRGYAVLILGLLGVTEAKKELECLRDDEAEIVIYENGQLVKKSISRLAAEALQRI